MRLRVSHFDLKETLGNAIHLLYLTIRISSSRHVNQSAHNTVCSRPASLVSSNPPRKNGDAAVIVLSTAQCTAIADVSPVSGV
jgi:hypothetical protein